MRINEAKKIVDEVEAQIAALDNGFRGRVLREYTRIDEQSVTVVVEPHGPGRAIDMIRAVDKIESRVEKKFKRDVMLVPVNPEVTDIPLRIGVPR